MIKINRELNNNSFKIISSIIRNLNIEITDDDITELFSIQLNDFSDFTLMDNNKLIEDEGSLR